jgi:UDPglucose--hexose-1-phosphate uridylyltransferase
VIISTERAKRPSDFVREPVAIRGGRFCPFCPGNETKTPPEILAYRPSGEANQPGWTLRVVPNKFPALRVEGELERTGDGLYDRMSGIGAHEVLIESPDHFATLATLEEKAIADLFWAFRERLLDLSRDQRMKYIIFFKNHGQAAGATLEHTHCQLIALPVVPKRVQEELDGGQRYFSYRERCIWCDMMQQEMKDGRRVVLQSEHFLVLTPYASRFPFELCVIPKAHASHFETVSTTLVQDLASILKCTLRKVDQALEKPAYNFLIHTAPLREAPIEHFHWHLEFIPRLTRVAGFEWGSGFYINPTPPEEAAHFLREARV